MTSPLDLPLLAAQHCVDNLVSYAEVPDPSGDQYSIGKHLSDSINRVFRVLIDACESVVLWPLTVGKAVFVIEAKQMRSDCLGLVTMLLTPQCWGKHRDDWSKGSRSRLNEVRGHLARLRKIHKGAASEAVADAAELPSVKEERPSPSPKNALRNKAKRSTERGEGLTKLISALTKHHQYANGSCLNSAPIGNNELAKAAGVSTSTASSFFNEKFGGHTKYKSLCRDTGKLIAALKLLNSEFAPHDLYGRRPAGEDDRDDK